MSAATKTPSIAVEFAVTLTAVVRPEPEAGGYSAEVPALPGCHTQGETLDEVRANLREAAEGWLAVAHDDTDVLPATTANAHGSSRHLPS